MRLSHPTNYVGIVNFYKNKDNAKHVIRAVRLLGYVPVVLHCEDVHWIAKAFQSPIRHWIGTGSEWNVIDIGAPRIPQFLLDNPRQRWFLICYSMQSFTYYSMRMNISRLPEKAFYLELGRNGEHYWRNHEFAFKKEDNNLFSRTDLKQILISNTDATIQRAMYKNSILTQYHPERTLEGIEEILTFLQN
jgi:GMP synthase-like glutamine amidotransferase